VQKDAEQPVFISADVLPFQTKQARQQEQNRRLLQQTKMEALLQSINRHMERLKSK
jgi:hypothetical protein